MKNKQGKSFPVSASFQGYLNQLKAETAAEAGEDKRSGSTTISLPDQPDVNKPKGLDPSINDQVSHSIESHEFSNEQAHKPSLEKVQSDVDIDSYTDSITQSSQTLPSASSMEQSQISTLEVVLNEKPTLSNGSSSKLTDLSHLLAAIPRASVTRQGFNRNEEMIKIAPDLTMVLRNLPSYQRLVDPKSQFELVDLVNYLLRQFVQNHIAGIQLMSRQLVKAEASRQQLITESLKSFDTH